jgi:hypothetical protein
MLPPEDKMQVLQKAHLGSDASDYSRLLRIRQSTQSQDEAINQINDAFNNEDATMNVDNPTKDTNK